MDEHNYTVFPMEETEKERRGRIKDNIAWYLKWFSSIIIVCAMSMRATGEVQYQIYDLWFSFVGVFGWLGVSLLWKDRALIMLNAVGLLILLSGILKSFI
jgi:pheromone shutdown protein TraB